MDKVRMAIVGCGSISQLNVPGYLSHEGCEVVALCDPEGERAKRMAAKWGIGPRIYERFEDVLNDSRVDAVELLTPTPLHAQQIVAALDAGKHVSCQKPVSTTVADADRVIAAAERAKTRVRVIENFLFYPPLVKAKELLDGGVIGEPSTVRIRTLWGDLESPSEVPMVPGAMEWRRDAATVPGGLIYDDGWHKFATAMWWIGDVERVSSMMTRTEDFYVEAPAVVTWKFRDRDCLGVFDHALAPQMDLRSRYDPQDEFFEIQGSKGLIWVTRCSGEMLDLPPVVVHTGRQSTGYQVPLEWSEGFNGSARNFIDSIIGDEEPLIDVQFAKRVLQVTLAAYRAADSGTQVDPSSVAD
jgi:predicted dehydrogenase